ncbi:MAG: carbohydrate-binding family 9-like protein [Anaerolineae bacterium]
MAERPLMTCYRAAKPIVVDGALDDPSWQEAEWHDLVLTADGAQPQQRTSCATLWDNRYLYVAFRCEDTDVWGITTERDRDIYNQEVVEVFIDDDRDGYGYIEIEVNPLNAVSDLFMFLREERRRSLWDWDSTGMRTAVQVDGDPTRRGTLDRGWTVELAIPMNDFMTAPHLPPRAGDIWHMNLYRIDRAESGDEYSAWSPTGILNYHVPRRFGRLAFSDRRV